MNSALSEVEGKMIATSVATREKALRVLRATRRPSIVEMLATSLSMGVVTIGLSGLQMPGLAKLTIGVACGLAFISAASAWRVHRQLSALADLLLLNEDQKR